MPEPRRDGLWTESEMKDEEAFTLRQRMEAFYRQSGGPNNPDIQRILNNHLKNGKDHGRRGHRQTVEDAFIETIVGDPTLLLVFERVRQWRNRKEQTTKGVPSSLQDDIRHLRSEVAALREEIASVKALLGAPTK
ncbi:hypothetical protein [Alicyclobacillus herbarius]|uniref:hypothetical protein n=1 Tax=Alicyclobacillus herbarius TaxID=122960 RepID=UPI0003F5DD0C|nr:hypothetical protein [Alicyclobacillus herbarius]